MVGLPPDHTIEVSTEEIPGAASDQAKDLVEQAMANNIELKQAETERRAREEKLKGERGGYWPPVSLFGQDNILSNTNNYTDFFKKIQRNNVIFRLEVRIPIFASRTISALALAPAELTAAQLQL